MAPPGKSESKGHSERTSSHLRPSCPRAQGMIAFDIPGIQYCLLVNSSSHGERPCHIGLLRTLVTIERKSDHKATTLHIPSRITKIQIPSRNQYQVSTPAPSPLRKRYAGAPLSKRPLRPAWSARIKSTRPISPRTCIIRVSLGVRRTASARVGGGSTHHACRIESDHTTPFRITRVGRRSKSRSSRGSPGTAIRSASLPISIVPIFPCRPMIFAELRVAA
jgi:hypothetical protein